MELSKKTRYILYGAALFVSVILMIVGGTTGPSDGSGQGLMIAGGVGTFFTIVFFVWTETSLFDGSGSEWVRDE